ncbi:MED4 [Candida theae]|uniref:Mediator of RNA polymerase II transcription subunit 4 n=1 Tax=Candida theae TaxID=1198502 RepID=A0AAD5BGX5_9ASCO|nr:MED4 [Candida theae]KAI5960916.1 MED4 [Candida theae]
MLTHHKENSPLRSRPVSRATSSTRLNQLSQESRISPNSNSRPSTPSAYIPSSLNPSKYNSSHQDSADDNIRSSEELDAFNAIPIVQKISHFRTALDTLSNGISHYKEDEFYSNIERIVETNSSLEKEVHELSKHKERSREIANLSDTNKKLENKLKDNLRALVGLRAELKKLPSVHREHANLEGIESPVDVESILNYSMKLAKFTKAPAAVGNVPFQIHPNNYIWPAEDSLRRGMLAMSSLHADEIVNAELSEGHHKKTDDMEEEIVEPESNEKSEGDSREKRQSKPQQTRRVSDAEEEQVGLDLDLFDPNDEYSD